MTASSPEHAAAVIPAAVRRTYFSEPFPAATGVVVAGLLRPGVVIEIEAIAAIPDPS